MVYLKCLYKFQTPHPKKEGGEGGKMSVYVCKHLVFQVQLPYLHDLSPSRFLSVGHLNT